MKSKLITGMGVKTLANSGTAGQIWKNAHVYPKMLFHGLRRNISIALSEKTPFVAHNATDERQLHPQPDGFIGG